MFMKKLKAALVAAGAALSSVASTADAAIVIDITQVGSDIVVTGSGSFDTTGLARTVQGGTFSMGMNPSFGVVRFGTGSTVGQISTYAVSGPAAFGTFATIDPYRLATTAVGDVFGIFGRDRHVILPLDYVSGSALSGKLTFANLSFSTLGLSAGTFVYSNARDSVAVNVGTAAVPEPASWAMMILGMGIVGAMLRRRARGTRTATSIT